MISGLGWLLFNAWDLAKKKKFPKAEFLTNVIWNNASPDMNHEIQICSDCHFSRKGIPFFFLWNLLKYMVFWTKRKKGRTLGLMNVHPFTFLFWISPCFFFFSTYIFKICFWVFMTFFSKVYTCNGKEDKRERLHGKMMMYTFVSFVCF